MADKPASVALTHAQERSEILVLGVRDPQVEFPVPGGVADFGGSGLRSLTTVVPGLSIRVTVTLTPFTVTSTGNGTGSSGFVWSGMLEVYSGLGSLHKDCAVKNAVEL